MLDQVDLSAAQAALPLCYLAILWLPGAALGALAGLRGWALAALSPLLSYGVVASTVPWMSTLGVPWTPPGAAVALLAALAVVGTLSWPQVRRRAADRDPLPGWTRCGHAAVAVAVAFAAVFGANVLLSSFGDLSSIPQDWDAMLHANGIRYIAETGDSSVGGMYAVNTFATGAQSYYPHSYHLIAALMFDLTAASIPEVLNAQSMLLPLMLALALVALVRAFHGRVALAVFAALVSPMATAVPYDLLWRGPLFPFVTGVVLVLGVLVALRWYLDRPSAGRAIPVVLGSAGLLGLHPSMLFTAALAALPMLAQRWWSRPRRIGPELLALAAPAVVGGLLVLPHLTGALSEADGVLAFDWPQTTIPAHAVGEVLGFSTSQALPQVWLSLLLLIGVLGVRALGSLRWVPVAGAVFAALYVLAAAYGTEWAQTATAPWWNDQWRLAAIATMTLLLVVAHGLVCCADVLAHRVLVPLHRVVSGSPPSRPARLARAPAVAVAVPAVAVGLFLLTGAGYAARNLERTEQGYRPNGTVSLAELAAFDVLGDLVEPGERVLNDRYDGSGWMYALEGVQPVAGHYQTAAVGEGPLLLAEAFDRYDTDPAVRQAVADLGVRWVFVGEGYVRSVYGRQPGLLHLDLVNALELRYAQDGVRIYELIGVLGSAASRATR